MHKSDFREELRVELYPEHKLTWIIEVASDKGHGKAKARWQTIDKLVFNESITSKACDQRLHFTHPRLNQ